MKALLRTLAGPRAALWRLLAGAVVISFTPVWVTLTEADPTTSGFYRLLIGGGVLFAWVWWRSGRPIPRPGLCVVLALAGASFALDLFFWHRSILYVGAGVSTLLANFQVFILLFAGIWLYRQRPTPLQWLAVPLAVFGLALIVGLDWRALSPEYRLGVIFGLLTAVSYAGYILGLRAARSRATPADAGSPMRDIAVASLAGAVVLAGLTPFTGESLALPGWRDAWLITGYALTATVIGWVLISSALAYLSAARAGLVLLAQPTLSFVWDIAFFGRSFTAVEAAGAAIALTAIYLGVRGRDAASPRPPDAAERQTDGSAAVSSAAQATIDPGRRDTR